ncbi:NADP-dependent oxidoreductase [Sphingorhabdus sp. Alg239-R122]|uniref:NADP-dependent oxidoreductase n=1 Tax=Sphingorhabdus sp. Alg239-R122 TaxID=2305989 RepID=UPI0013DC63A4|nr:NADP-dependent oxidoreductase [Sphingorhabdus sp. Alg239-R122]
MSDYPGAGSVRDIWRTTHDPIRPVEDGEALVRLDHISVDPGMRGWITNKRSYMPPVKPAGVMRAFGVGEVIESRAEGLAVGDQVTGFTGVQTHGVFKEENLRKIGLPGVPPHLFLSGLGMTGYTGYFGMTDIGQPKDGETVVVSAASGAVGSIAAQAAKLAGAHVIGIAGGPDKCSYLTDELGLDGAIDYKRDDVEAALHANCTNGIDLYFDNVGGDILSAVLNQMNYQGRIVVCGGISQYDDFAGATGPANFMTVVTHSLTMRGFTMRDYMHRVPEALGWLVPAWKDGRIKFREHILEGVENFPDAFDMIFEGKNHGKLLLKVS